MCFDEIPAREIADSRLGKTTSRICDFGKACFKFTQEFLLPDKIPGRVHVVALRAAEKLDQAGFVRGPDFSRADQCNKTNGASAPANCPKRNIPQDPEFFCGLSVTSSGSNKKVAALPGAFNKIKREPSRARNHASCSNPGKPFQFNHS